PVPFYSSFFPHTSPPAIYTLSLHDALPIFSAPSHAPGEVPGTPTIFPIPEKPAFEMLALTKTASLDIGPDNLATEGDIITYTLTDRKSTRLNSSHVKISYAVFCLKKKKAMR